MSRIIVITGAGEGLGRALARRFAKDGETVVALGRTVSKVEAVATELGEPAVALQCDVSSPDSVRTAFAWIAERFGKIDVLINNAAVYQPVDVVDATDEQILGMVNTNLSGPMFCCRSAIPLMERGGTIINVSSESVALPYRMLSFYQASKFGLERFTESLSTEIEERGIRVTTARAGSMWEEGKVSGFSPEVGMRFAQLNIAAGIDVRTRPLSHVNSVTDVFRALIDLPPDVRITHVSIEGRKA
ncbi:MAG TPA: SDR family oxidoreductase [Novosphingobium sp.]